jgi:hypothetical protein
MQHPRTNGEAERSGIVSGQNCVRGHEAALQESLNHFARQGATVGATAQSLTNCLLFRLPEPHKPTRQRSVENMFLDGEGNAIPEAEQAAATEAALERLLGCSNVRFFTPAEVHGRGLLGECCSAWGFLGPQRRGGGGGRGGGEDGRGSEHSADPSFVPDTEPYFTIQEARNRPNIDWQEKIHRGILRGLSNISDTP